MDMKSVFRKAAALGLIFCMSCMLLAGCGGKSGVDGSKNLMTVNGEDLRLGAASFYAKYEQAETYMLYSMYFGATNIFDTEQEEGTTYGDSMKESVLADLKKMMVIKQHADEYGVSVTDEQASQIQEAAKAYIEGNDKEALEKVGASEEDVVTLMTLQTIQAAMMDPIVKDVDTEVSDEEAQQTSVTYIRVPVEETTESEAESTEEEAGSTASGAESAAASAAESTAATESTAASAAESTAATESAAASAAESTAATESAAASAAESAEAATESSAEEAESAEETEAQKEAREYAEAMISAILESEDVAAADMDAIAKEIDADYYASTGTFTTNDHEDTSLDANLVEAVQGLADGEVLDHAVLGSDGDCYYVVRLDKNFDEDATNEEKENIVTDRKQTLFDETVDSWVEEAEITVNEDVWKTLTITDKDPVTLKNVEEETTEESVAEEAASGAASAAEEAASTAVSAAEEALSTAEEVVSAATGTAEEAVSKAEEAVSAAADTAEEASSKVEEVVSAATDAAEEAVSKAEEAVSTATEAVADEAKEVENAAVSAAKKAAEAAASAVEKADDAK